MAPTRRELGWALAGAVVVGTGAGTATLAAFAPSLPAGPENFATRTLVVAIGYAIFFAGYHISQVGTYRNPETPLLLDLLPVPTSVDAAGASNAGVASDAADSTNAGAGSDATAGTTTPLVAVRGLFIILGVLGLGAGMRLFALTVQSWDPLFGVLAGTVSIGGYICGHIGINWVLL